MTGTSYIYWLNVIFCMESILVSKGIDNLRKVSLLLDLSTITRTCLCLVIVTYIGTMEVTWCSNGKSM